MGIQGVVVFVFWKAKGKEVGLGKQKNRQATGEKNLQRGRQIFVSLGGNFELWNQAVIFLKGFKGASDKRHAVERPFER